MRLLAIGITTFAAFITIVWAGAEFLYAPGDLPYWRLMAGTMLLLGFASAMFYGIVIPISESDNPTWTILFRASFHGALAAFQLLGWWMHRNYLDGLWIGAVFVILYRLAYAGMKAMIRMEHRHSQPPVAAS